jgi:ABC-2 type transport system ATP-binding protein
MTEIAISVRGLQRSYGTKVAVAGLDLDVRTGEVFALLGPNGAGKTTTVEILEGYRRRDAGDVLVLGRDPAHPTREWRCRIGIVLQSAGDLSELTVEEVVRHFAGFYPDPRRWDDVIDQVGLTDQRSSRTRALSGGQRRRLDVALGIVGAPELLFLDEPTTGFDPEARRDFWGLIETLQEGGTTIVLTTHYLDEAERLADRVAVIAAGRILALDSPQQLGGRSQAGVVVRWWQDDRMHLEETSTPTRLVGELADRLGGEVPRLTVTRPTLEDTYLRLIGEHG